VSTTPDSTSWQQFDDHKGGENVGGQSLVQHEIQLSYSSYLARMVRRSDMSEWEAILADLTNGMRLSRSVESSTKTSIKM
jgi:hypothetical protein